MQCLTPKVCEMILVDLPRSFGDTYNIRRKGVLKTRDLGQRFLVHVRVHSVFRSTISGRQLIRTLLEPDRRSHFAVAESRHIFAVHEPIACTSRQTSISDQRAQVMISTASLLHWYLIQRLRSGDLSCSPSMPVARPVVG